MSPVLILTVIGWEYFFKIIQFSILCLQPSLRRKEWDNVSRFFRGRGYWLTPKKNMLTLLKRKLYWSFSTVKRRGVAFPHTSGRKPPFYKAGCSGVHIKACFSENTQKVGGRWQVARAGAGQRWKQLSLVTRGKKCRSHLRGRKEREGRREWGRRKEETGEQTLNYWDW